MRGTEIYILHGFQVVRSVKIKELRNTSSHCEAPPPTRKTLFSFRKETCASSKTPRFQSPEKLVFDDTHHSAISWGFPSSSRTMKLHSPYPLSSPVTGQGSEKSDLSASTTLIKLMTRGWREWCSWRGC